MLSHTMKNKFNLSRIPQVIRPWISLALGNLDFGIYHPQRGKRETYPTLHAIGTDIQDTYLVPSERSFSFRQSHTHYVFEGSVDKRQEEGVYYFSDNPQELEQDPFKHYLLLQSLPHSEPSLQHNSCVFILRYPLSAKQLYHIPLKIKPENLSFEEFRR